ncbi:GH1 family beta-glucosidase [Actinocorallia sp. A-T 12471]|uniref:GH1 family beta-glucosidase n=1 Tax=Actinocorallia sp. A-T 12471 TaxID=3089813 RepID=UPI0029D38194|nr:GH1 family beta-glucosidase [Actinocorallia sp. A-T 12471]MDX6743372.1 GH1 family beta-glucosidase [Actinocorallia sp. A-T 12471]
MATRGFPDGFAWGAATAAYQIEGSVTADGRGASIWDTFAHTPGRVLNGENGDVAVDHYNRYADDVALMGSLGLNAYRFSLSWPRVQPGGRGVNGAGLDFYKRLVDELLAKGITPYATLYHWDLPQELQDAGGWPERDTAYRFAEYAQLAHEALSDRVKHWMTVNEPWCAAFLGYGSGDHAPGLRSSEQAVRAAHHLLLAHGLAAPTLRGNGCLVGAAPNLYAVSPVSETEADLDAARRIDGLQNRFFLDALLRGSYPADVVADLEPFGFSDVVLPGDLETIGGKVDFLGVNYYSRHTVTADPDAAGLVATSPFASASPWPGAEHVAFVNAGRPVTDMGWEVDPEGLYEILTRVAKEYPPVPLYITENGAAYVDELVDGEVADTERLDYIAAHLAACHDAIAAGVPLKGYFAWSLMDNFEWGWGYGKRFGLVHVDYTTQVRTPKASARWYGGVARHNGLS